MRIQLNRLLCGVSVVSLLFASGCATSPQKRTTHKTLSQSLSEESNTSTPHSAAKAAQPRSATELLRAANEAFRKANEAQEGGDREAALRHYTQMLELLIKADLDPSVFYSLRGEFERVLADKGKQQDELLGKAPKTGVTTGELAKGLADELQMTGPLPERVLQQLEQIQGSYPKNFQAGLSRSYLYAPYIREEFVKAGLPPDLIYLAQVESQFSPKVVSRAGAGGMWQFMRGTAKRYDIRMDNYVDERFDWKKSTQAAICYLTELYERFDHNWPLAITAYNMGEGGVEKAIAANGGERNLWKLIDTPPASERMQDETKDFYAKLLATIIAARAPERYGLTVQPRTPIETTEIPVTGTYSLEDLEQACGLETGALAELNPDLVRKVTPGDGHPVVVPSATKDRFTVALNEVPQTRRLSRFALAASNTDRPVSVHGKTSHTVRRGETLASIASKYEVSIGDLAAANKIGPSSRLISGQRLAIPTSEGSSRSEKVQVAKKSSARDDAETSEDEGQGDVADASSSVTERTYKVKPGDTLGAIAKAENISVRELAEWNDLRLNKPIVVGQDLVVKTAGMSGEVAKATKETAKVAKGEKTESIQHTIKAGETPEKIAREYNVDVKDLYAWNNLSPKSIIKSGHKLTVRTASASTETEADSSPATTKKAEKSATKSAEKTVVADAKSSTEKASVAETQKTHKVAKGETPWVIASKYGVSLKDFMEWNNLTEDSVLRVGDECVVSVAEASGTLTEEPIASVPDTKSTAKKTASASKADASSKDKTQSPYRTVKGKSSASLPAKQTYVVVKGDSPSAIAQKLQVPLGDLYTWNGWSKSTVLRVGQQVVVTKK